MGELIVGILLFIIFSFGLLSFTRFLVNNFFYSYLQAENARQKFDTATDQNNPDKAWIEVALYKAAEIGRSGTPYQRRKQNLAYIKQVGPNRRVLDKLIQTLPNQRNLEFQKEMACFICESLKNIHETNNALEEKPNTPRQTLLSVHSVLQFFYILFVHLPRIFGRAILDIFGRGKDSADTTSSVVGYAFISLVTLVVGGFLDIVSVIEFFVSLWRFFFPLE